MISSKLFAIIITGIFFLLVVELVRREKLTFKYAAGWMATLVLAAVLAVFDTVLFQISHWFGFELPSNFVFFILLCIFAFLGLLLTIFLCQQDNRNHIIAQKIAMLENELKKKEGGSSDG